MLLQHLAGSLVLLSGFSVLGKGLEGKGTLLGFGISLPFCVASSIQISLKFISWLNMVWG